MAKAFDLSKEDPRLRDRYGRHQWGQSALLAPDTTGLNFYRADPALTDLLRLYLPDALFRHMEPHLDRLGALAGGRYHPHLLRAHGSVKTLRETINR